jgi:MFS family permease
MGLVESFSQLLALRLLLGLFECGLFPGISLYLTGWYRVSLTGGSSTFHKRDRPADCSILAWNDVRLIVDRTEERII